MLKTGYNHETVHRTNSLSCMPQDELLKLKELKTDIQIFLFRNLWFSVTNTTVIAVDFFSH